MASEGGERGRGFFSRLLGGAQQPVEPEPELAPAELDRRRIAAYHQVTKHDFHAFAHGPHGLDWATQPDPFRRYAGARAIALERLPDSDEPVYEVAMGAGRVPSEPLERFSISRLFQDSLALTAWKQAGGSRWALRANPSSGNLHPTEGYLVTGAIDGLLDAPCVCHYAPREHALELRARIPDGLWQPIAAALPAGGFLLGLSSIHWREEWKYGERAFRYCQHDVGHAIGALAIAAAALGWRVDLLDELSSDDVAAALGVGAGDPDGPEPEHPDCLLAAYPQGARFEGLPRACLAGFAALEWQGSANTLSGGHLYWDAIEAAARATWKPASKRVAWRSPYGAWQPSDRQSPLRYLVRTRRSAVDMDGRTSMSRDDFYRVLRMTLPRPGQFPFSALPFEPRVHLALFVQRVDDLEHGLYLLVRDPQREAELRGLLRAEFVWQRAPEAPDELGLWLLHAADVRGLAARLSCQQAIAGDGCFSLGMLCELERPLEELGAWIYPRLFWEAGALGQVLYLEAEALGLRATGIGCYFDDPVHAVLGLRTRRYQSLYHFTVGGPVDDPRITTLPAY